MTPDGFDPHRAIPGTTHATPEQQRAWAEQQATQIADAVFPAGGGVVSTPNAKRPVERIVDGICARAERGEVALTQEEFDALQEVVMAWERGMVPRGEYDAMVAARDHCKRQTNECGERLVKANVELARARLRYTAGDERRES